MRVMIVCTVVILGCYKTQIKILRGKKVKYVLRDYSVLKERKIRKWYLSYPIPHKAKEVTFKILNIFIHRTTSYILDLIGIIIHVFCESDIETIFSLNVIQIILHPLNWMSIKVGVKLEEKNLDFLVSNLTRLGKHFIHRCEYLNVKPHVNWLKNELKIYKKSLDYMKKQKCPETLFFIGLISPLEEEPHIVIFFSFHLSCKLVQHFQSLYHNCAVIGCNLRILQII